MSEDKASDQEKIIHLQKEFHSSQLALNECGVELQKIRARLLKDLLDLEIYHHANERKAFDVKMAQLKDQFDAARSEMEQIKFTKVAPLKERASENECISNKDAPSIIVSETAPAVPEDTVTTEQEASLIHTDNVSSPQQVQATTSLSAAVNVSSDEKKTTHDCQGNTCSTKQTTENQRQNNNETASDITGTVAAKRKRPKGGTVRKRRRNTQKKRKAPSKVTGESAPSSTGGISKLTESESKGDTDVHSDVLNSTTNATVLFGADKDTEEDNGLNEHSCQQDLHKEMASSIPITVVTINEEQNCHDLSLPTSHVCHSTTSKNDVPFCEGSVKHQEGNDNNTLTHLSGECSTAPSTVLTATNEEDVTKHADGLDKQQNCEGIPIHKDSIPTGNHDNEIANYCDALLLPNMHQELPSDCLQIIEVVTCSMAQSEASGQQNVNENENEVKIRQEMVVQGVDSDATTMKSEVKKHKKVTSKKGVARKRKGKGRLKTKNVVNQGITIPDSSGIQNDCSDGLVENSEIISVAINNSETKSPPEPFVSSTSNGAIDGCMESSNNKRSTVHGDQEFITVKKLKLENNSITSPSNLVTSTSSGDDIIASRSSLTAEYDTVASTTDDGNPSINDDKDPDRGTASKPRGIGMRKHQRPKKKATTVKKAESSHNGELENGREATSNNVAVATATSLVDTKEMIQTKSVLESHELHQLTRKGNEVTLTTHEEQLPKTFDITTHIKLEPKAYPLTTIPLTKNSVESAGVKAHGQKPVVNKQRKLVSLKSLNRRLMPDISFKGDTPRSSVVFSLHNMTAPKLKASIKPTLK